MLKMDHVGKLVSPVNPVKYCTVTAVLFDAFVK